MPFRSGLPSGKRGARYAAGACPSTGSAVTARPAPTAAATTAISTSRTRARIGILLKNASTIQTLGVPSQTPPGRHERRHHGRDPAQAQHDDDDVPQRPAPVEPREIEAVESMVQPAVQ